MFPRTPLLLAALSLAACCAGAQTVYRCGSSYSAQPCPGATALDVTDQRPPADAARAGKVASDDWKRAEAMEKARLAQEKNAPRALVIGQKEPPPREPAKGHKDKDKKKGKAEDPNVFTAGAPREPKKK